MATGDKAPGAFKTIGELSAELGVAQHILRYWETKFPQLRPLQRAGNRRYYRQADVQLAHRINALLNREGYTMRGAQQLLRSRSPEPEVESAPPPQPHQRRSRVDVERLRALRNQLADALES